MVGSKLCKTARLSPMSCLQIEDYNPEEDFANKSHVFFRSLRKALPETECYEAIAELMQDLLHPDPCERATIDGAFTVF